MHWKVFNEFFERLSHRHGGVLWRYCGHGNHRCIAVAGQWLYARAQALVTPRLCGRASNAQLGGAEIFLFLAREVQISTPWPFGFGVCPIPLLSRCF